jgi:hypothetical protein
VIRADKMMHAWMVAALIVAVVACGGPEADTPEWTALDAKVLLRDYLLSENRTFEHYLIYDTMVVLADFDSWESAYEGEGWWRVSGWRLGQVAGGGSYSRSSGGWLVSERTNHVAPDDDAAAQYLACLNNEQGCIMSLDDFRPMSTSTAAIPE